MATALIGSINPFDFNTETWTSYQERLEQYFIVNGINDEKKVAGLLTLLGEKSYGLLRSLTSPLKPSEKTYDELCALLKEHLSPKPLLIAERFRFHKRNQATGESINDYVATLRKLSEHCDFGTNLTDTLRDRFVCGLRDENTQRKLLSTSELTFEKAISVAVSMETATKDASELQTATGSVHKIKLKRTPFVKKDKTKDKTPSHRSEKNCFHCGKNNHESQKCRFKNAVCHFCKKKGHIQRICLKKSQINSLSEEDNVLLINTITPGKNKIMITPTIDEQSIEMELDTGSAVSIISEDIYQQTFGKTQLDKPHSVLKSYSGDVIPQAGTKRVKVSYNGQEKDLTLHIVKGGGPSLFGRDWLFHIKLDWENIVSVNSVSNDTIHGKLNELLKKHAAVFSDGIGKVEGIKARLTLKDGVQPKFFKARPVAYSMKPKIEKELDNLEKQGILSKVDTSEWGTPIVPVVKANGDVRICGDFKVTVNQGLTIDKYPLPRIEDIFASLAGGQKFSKLDLRQAYLQLECDDQSKELLTINTHKGLYRYNRLMYGVASAPAIWQRTMDQILQGVPGVQCILDDMVITGEDDHTHMQNLEKVLSRLSSFGIKVNKDKCVFLQSRITFCGHDIDKNGLWKCDDKVRAVLETPAPRNVTELRAYLGVLNYYHRFLKNLATVVKPLNALLEKGKKFAWSAECETAFQQSKRLLTSEPVLTHYDPNLPVRLAADASPYGISGIISHVMQDGTEKPIAYASRSLSKTEQKYAQIDREALGIFWAVKKFYPYLYGRKFTLVTDCQPLTSIFSPSKSIPATTAARVQRYALYLSGFDYDIEYKCTRRHTNVDGLSRLPAQNHESSEDIDEVFYTSQFDQLPVTSSQISRETQRERVMSRVLEYTKNGWSSDANEPLLKGYYSRRNEISIHRGCLMWGNRVIIPTKLRARVLEMLHASHPGIVKMKGLARSYVWWPGIDADIECLVKSCQSCAMQHKQPAQVNLHPWEWPSSSWERIHVDYAGPFLGRMFLVMVDAHSKWPEVFEMKSTTAERTIQVMRTCFARYGLPKQVVTDNGSVFTSESFQLFMKTNGILHIRTAVAKPSTNGLVERFNATFKTSMRAMNHESDDLNKKLNCFLLMYRNTPHSTTNETPAKLFMGRNLRVRLDLLKPDTKQHVTDIQMKTSFSDRAKFRELELGQKVLARDFRPSSKEKWVTGIIVSRDGPLMYKIDLGNVVWRRHIDQLRATGVQTNLNDRENVSHPLINEARLDMGNSDNLERNVQVNENRDTTQNSSVLSDSEVIRERRYPLRDRRPPDRLSY